MTEQMLKKKSIENLVAQRDEDYSKHQLYTNIMNWAEKNFSKRMQKIRVKTVDNMRETMCNNLDYNQRYRHIDSTIQEDMRYFVPGSRTIDGDI